jgi:dTDP-4-amino-4,6-dideoxygalactose transaminase
MIHYPVPIHRTPAYQAQSTDETVLAETVRAADEIVSLPLYPELTDAEVDDVIAAARASL